MRISTFYGVWDIENGRIRKIRMYIPFDCRRRHGRLIVGFCWLPPHKEKRVIDIDYFVCREIVESEKQWFWCDWYAWYFDKRDFFPDSCCICTLLACASCAPTNNRSNNKINVKVSSHFMCSFFKWVKKPRYSRLLFTICHIAIFIRRCWWLSWHSWLCTICVFLILILTLTHSVYVLQTESFC